jgi:hypothetical protein
MPDGPFWKGCPDTDNKTGFHTELSRFNLNIGPQKLELCHLPPTINLAYRAWQVWSIKKEYSNLTQREAMVGLGSEILAGMNRTIHLACEGTHPRKIKNIK